MRIKCMVHYGMATYSGYETVYCDGDDENDVVIEKAKQQLRQVSGPLPYGYQSFRIMSREEVVEGDDAI